MTQELQSLDWYLKTAVKVIKAHGHPDMLKSEDDISTVATSIMTADSVFDGRGTIEGFRSARGRFAILRLFEQYNKRRTGDISLYHRTGEDSQFHETLADDKARTGEEECTANDIISHVENARYLRFRERDAIILNYVQGYTCEEIASVHNITKQAVSLNIKSGIDKVKKYLGVDDGSV